MADAFLAVLATVVLVCGRLVLLALLRTKRARAIFWATLLRTVLGIAVVLGPVSITYLMCRLVAPKQFVEVTVTVYVITAVAAVFVALAVWAPPAAQAPPVRRFVKRPDTMPPANSVEREQRAYAERLTQFVHDTAPGELPMVPERSRMAFFANFIPGRRHLPKSAAAIREILWRIRCRLHGA